MGIGDEWGCRTVDDARTLDGEGRIHGLEQEGRWAGWWVGLAAWMIATVLSALGSRRAEDGLDLGQLAAAKRAQRAIDGE